MTQTEFIPIREIPHWNYYRILLLAIGLWPYQRSKLVRFQKILFSNILSSMIFFQLTIFLTSKCTPDLIINVFISISIPVIVISLYSNFWINMNIMKYLLDQFRHTYNELKDKKEIAIMEKYARKSKHFAIQLTLLGFVGSLLAYFCSFGSAILGKRMNESRLSHFPISTEYFIDQEKYFYVTLLHTNLAWSIAVITLLSLGIISISFLLYACGMFAIASYRIQQAIAISILQNINPEVENIICKRLSYAVDIHCKSMMFCNLFVSGLEKIFYFVLIIIVAATSFCAYIIFKTILSGNSIEESVWNVIILCSFLTTIFLSNYVSQEITDYNNRVYVTAYNIRWYAAPVRIQKLILFLLQRGSKVFVLRIGIIVGSLETFATVISACVSYITVFCAMEL